MNNLFLPINRQDMEARGWTECDVILVTGDAYVDHPSYGAAVIGRVLEDAGYRVGMIAQPDWRNDSDFRKLGMPRLFFGITAGNLDSMLSQYTANKKPRREDDYSPGGKTGLRPKRASIVYANRVREAYPGVPVILGGIEASLMRFAFYSYWDDEVRRSILADAKADLLIYGMGERAILQAAERIRRKEGLEGIPGSAVMRSDLSGLSDFRLMPSFEEAATDKDQFNEAFKRITEECDPFRGKILVQPHGDRFLTVFPPAKPLSPRELDHIYELPYVRRCHPVYDPAGGVPGFKTVQFSIVSHRGCSAECHFCSLYAHQGRMIQSRSAESILREVKCLTEDKDFKGTISDLGGPTANLYDAFCERWSNEGTCRGKQCLMPSVCGKLKLGYRSTIELWKKIRSFPGVKHLFVASGLRYDLLIDRDSDEYLRELCAHHVSGQLKVAPEHFSNAVLRLMNKSAFERYETFVRRFKEMNRALKKNQFLVNYFVSAHPGSSLKEALDLALRLAEHHAQPEQIQDFIPLPMTASTCMYYTGKNPFTGETVYIPKSLKEREMQRALLQYKQPQNQERVREALKILKRPELERLFLKKRSQPGRFRDRHPISRRKKHGKK